MRWLSAAAILSLAFGAGAVGQPMNPYGTAFTYQGQLMHDGTPMSGTVDMRFALFNEPNADPNWGVMEYYTPPGGVSVNSGLFTTPVEFSDWNFTGDALWLGVEVHETGPGWVRVGDVQPLRAVPFALHAKNGWDRTGDDLHWSQGNVAIGSWPSSNQALKVRAGTDEYALIAEAGWGSNGYAIIGLVDDPNGWAGWFGGRGYFEGAVGIGTEDPAAELDVIGTIRTTGLQMPTGAVPGWVLTCDPNGNAFWSPTGSGGDSPWSENGSDIYYSGGNIGAGTTSPQAQLHVVEADPNATALRVESTSEMASSIYATATGAGGTGMSIMNYGSANTGLWISSQAGTGTNYGARLYTYGNDGVGLYSRVSGGLRATAHYGGWFEATGENSRGVYGYTSASGDDGAGIGGEFVTDGDIGVGVKGIATSSTGMNIGVYGESPSSDGHAGYFVGRGFFSGDVGIGTLTPQAELDVLGKVRTNALQLTNSPSAGYVLTSDASGNASWAPASGGGESLWSQNGSEIYYNSGNVGIDVSDPQAKLHVSGGNWDVASGEGDFKIGTSTYRLKMGVATAGGGAGICRIYAGSSAGKVVLGANASDRLSVTPTGVGISTLSPTTDLDVAGTIETDALRLTASPTAGHVLTSDSAGNASWQPATGGLSLPYSGTTSANDAGFSITNTGTGISSAAIEARLNNASSHPDAAAGVFVADGSNGMALWARNDSATNTLRVDHDHTTGTGLYVYSNDDGIKVNADGTGLRVDSSGTYSSGVSANVTGSDATAVYANATSGAIGITAKGPYAAGTFYGNVFIYEFGTQNKVLELGKGLDYAEGFDVTDAERIGPGTVLVIDAKNPGRLVASSGAYDRKVAGIVAGAQGLGSGVRLGGEGFDHDVALAGRVYCNVIAKDEPIEPGDLLTTADVEGYAMKVADHPRAQGAILGKAMQPLAAGQRGQILVLVTLQ